MIRTEELVVDERTLVESYSDAGYKMERDGVRYNEAIDPIETGRTYTETDEKIEGTEISDAEALRIITGE